jgi:hypothetical protein
MNYNTQDWRKYAGTTYPDQDVEKAFLDQAYIFIQNKATPLMRDPYRLGFEIVFKNDDNTRMVGIFVFRVDNDLLYAPVFFINGDIKGTDLLYRHNTKKFVPLTNDWCQYLISLSTYSEGKKISKDKTQGTRGMNVQELIMPPAYSKSASEAWDSMQKEAAESPEKGSLLKKFILEDGGYSAVELLTNNAVADTKYASHLIEHVGMENVMPDELNEDTRNKPAPVKEELIYEKGFFGEKYASNGGKITDTRTKLVCKIITNESEKEHKADSYGGKHPRWEHDVYDIIHKDGTSGKYKVAAIEDSNDVLVLADDGWQQVPADSLSIAGHEKDAASEEDSSEKQHMKQGSWYTQVLSTDENLKVTEPFKVVKEMDTLSDGVDRFKVKNASGKADWLTFRDDEEKYFLQLPQGDAEFKLMDTSNLDQLAKGANLSKASVFPRGHYFIVDSVKGMSPEMPKLASQLYLMAELGMDEETSESIMEKAASSKFTFYYEPLEKYATNLSFEQPPEFYAGFDPDFGVQSESPEAMKIVSDSDQPHDPSQRVGDGMKFDSGESIGGHNADSLAQLSMDTGQSSLFEHGAVGSLVDTYDSTILIDKYIPNMEDGLDKIGRLLFLFYWKPNDFSRLYGSDDQSGLENKLVSNFKSFGDLVLELLKKTKFNSAGIALSANN